MQQHCSFVLMEHLPLNWSHSANALTTFKVIPNRFHYHFSKKVIKLPNKGVWNRLNQVKALLLLDNILAHLVKSELADDGGHISFCLLINFTYSTNGLKSHCGRKNALLLASHGGADGLVWGRREVWPEHKRAKYTKISRRCILSSPTATTG